MDGEPRMPKKLPPQNPRGACRRKSTRQRVVGLTAQCKCGESRPEALIPDRDPVVCMDCDRRNHGISDRDDHHIAGAANDRTTISVPVNDHAAELTAPQRDWPKQTLQNPDRSPLLSAAGHIRGFVDTLVYLINKFLLWIAKLLEFLDTMLQERWGPRYWKDTKLEAFEPED
jgi:hypothetical protein